MTLSFNQNSCHTFFHEKENINIQMNLNHFVIFHVYYYEKNRDKTISQVFCAIQTGSNNKMFDMKTPNIIVVLIIEVFVNFL